MPPPFFFLKKEPIPVTIMSLSTRDEKNLTPSPSAGNSMLTTHTQRAQAGFPAATQGLRSWEQNPALPHFPGNGTGLNGSFGLYKKLQKGLGTELLRRGYLLPAPVTQRALAT